MGNSNQKPIMLNVRNLEVGSVVPCGVVKKTNPIEIVPWDEVWDIKHDNEGDLEWFVLYTRHDEDFVTSTKDIDLINFNNLNCKCFEDTKSSR
jgi:hypothetical protein